MGRLFNPPVGGRFVGTATASPHALAVHLQKNFALVKVCYGRSLLECTGVQMAFQRMEQQVPASAARELPNIARTTSPRLARSVIA
jgi:hypothetical protein